MRFCTVVAAVIAAGLLTWDAASQCTASQGYTAGSAASIGIKVGSGWTESGKQAPPIGAAVGFWTACPESDDGFASLVANGNGDFNILVKYFPTPMPSFGNGTGDSCARFDPTFNAGGQVAGGSIEVYARTANGADCLWALPSATLDNIIAHEIGHVLGLANVNRSECSNFIMGPNYPNVGVNAQECAWVAQQWKTPAERELAACELNCPYPCTGTPPVCDTTIDTGGGWQCPWSQCSPLILDLNGDGIHTTSADEPVPFDLTGDGVPEWLGWTHPATDEAFLWIDLLPNGRVDDGRELFGHGTILQNGRAAADGFEALAQYDRANLGGNGDGRISAEDRVWNRLRLWVDADHDGTSIASENAPVAAYGVLEIPLTFTIHEEADANGNVHRLRGSFTRIVRGDGPPRLRTFALHDVFFRALPLEAHP